MKSLQFSGVIAFMRDKMIDVDNGIITTPSAVVQVRHIVRSRPK